MTADDDPTYQGCRQHLSAFSGFDTGRVVGTCTDRSRRNAMGRRVKVTDEASRTTTQYLYDGLNPVTLTAGTSATTMLTGLNIDEYFSFANSTGSASLMTDVLGSIIALTDSTGAVYENYYYEPFGGSPPLIGAPSASAPLITIPFGFTGREDDDGTVYYYRARYYNTYLRRFLSQDPLDFDGGDTNLYGYTFNSPTNLRDPSGKIVPIILIAGGLIGGGAAAYSNYGAYESGAITGGEYAEAIALGTGVGVLTAIPTGIVGSIIAGGLGSAVNNLVDQRLRQPCGSLNLGTVGEAGLIGAGGGFVAGGLGELGENIISLNPSIGETLPEVSGGYPTPGYTTLGTPGGIVGNAIGTGAGAYLGPQ